MARSQLWLGISDDAVSLAMMTQYQ
jgi:hypothetical protein